MLAYTLDVELSRLSFLVYPVSIDSAFVDPVELALIIVEIGLS